MQSLTNKLIPEAGEGWIHILPWNYSAIIQGTWVITAHTSLYYDFYFTNSSHANVDQVDYKIYLGAGTYDLYLLGYTGADEGILDVLVDGVSIGTFDLYAGVAYNVRFYMPFSVTISGLKTLSFKVNGKNPLSSNYYLLFTYVTLVRM